MRFWRFSAIGREQESAKAFDSYLIHPVYLILLPIFFSNIFQSQKGKETKSFHG